MSTTYLFDLDGTLADTDADIRASWKLAIADAGLSCPTFDTDFITGPTLEEMVVKLFPGHDPAVLAPRLREHFSAHYDHDGFPLTREYPGVLDAVRRLKAAGARVFIATNKRHVAAVAIARHFGWESVFEGVYAGDMLAAQGGPKMRKPELLAHLMATEGVTAADCIMVGDTINDFEAARKNGIRSIAVAWGYGTDAERAQADRLVRTPEEL